MEADLLVFDSPPEALNQDVERQAPLPSMLILISRAASTLMKSVEVTDGPRVAWPFEPGALTRSPHAFHQRGNVHPSSFEPFLDQKPLQHLDTREREFHMQLFDPGRISFRSSSETGRG